MVFWHLTKRSFRDLITYDDDNIAKELKGLKKKKKKKALNFILSLL